MKSFPRRALVLASAVALALATVAAAPALAQSSSYYMNQRGMDERFRLDLGGFFQKFTTTLSLSNAAGSIGTEINAEDDLGQDANQTNIAADGYWRFGPHGRLDFSYRGWNRSASRSLSRDFVFGDTTYHAGAQVDSRFRVTEGELYYAYSFVNNGDLEFGLGLGASVYFNSANIEGTGTFSGPGGAQTTTFHAESRSYVIPIPAAKAYFSYALYPRFFIYGSVKGITGTIDGYHAEMVDWRAGLDYVFLKNFGAGVAYQNVKIEASHAGEAADFAFTYKYEGPLAYVIFAF